MNIGAVKPEILLCDSSFVSHVARRGGRPQDYSHWPAKVLGRISGGIQAISVVTLAESRAGFLMSDWGAKRIAREEKRLAAYLRVPLDLEIVNEWARLRHLTKTAGEQPQHNDLWIAASASARAYPLVACDGHFTGVIASEIEVIHLAPPK